MSSNALLWPSQGTKPEEILDKHKYLRIPSQGIRRRRALPSQLVAIYPPIATQPTDLIVSSGIDLDISPEDTSPSSLTISSDGLTLFMIGATNDKIFQYNLTIPNDLSTATFSGNELDVSTEDAAAQGLAISSNGLRIFMAGSQNDKIYQYNLSTANDLSTAVFSGNDLVVSSEDTSPQGLTASSDGLTLFMVGAVSTKIFQYDLTIVNDLSTATFSGTDLDVSTEDVSPSSITITSDGLKIFIVGAATDKIYQYNLTISNDLSTATFSGTELDVSTEDAAPQGLTVSSDGLRLFMAGSANDKIFQYILTVVTDLSGATFSGNDLDISPQDSSPDGLTISTNGLRIFMVGSLSDKIHQYNLTIANDLSTATFSGNELDISPQDIAPEGLTISSDGLTIFLMGSQNDTIFQYNLTTPNDLSTATFSGNELDVNTEDGAPIGITVSTDGLRIFITGSGNDKIFQYNLTTANDLSTATFSGNELDVSTEETSPQDLTISTDGLKIFMVGTANDKIYQYNLTIANDLSTATFSGTDLDISAQDTAPQGLTVSSDGLEIFMLGTQNNKISQYNLPIVDVFQFYQFYQINPNQIPVTQTNMPLVIIATLGSGILQEASGFDIRVFDSAGLPLEYEIQSANVTTGEIVVWVNMTTAKDSEFIQLVYGNPTATDESTPSAVWDSNYVIVLQMTPSLLDSTSNNNDATNGGSVDIAGKIGQARDFDGINDFLEVDDSPELNITQTITLSAWVKSSDPDGIIVNKDNLSGNRPYSLRRFNSGTLSRFGLDLTAPTFLNGIILLSSTEFDYIVATYDGTTMKLYNNGVLDNTLIKVDTIDVNGIPLFIGKRGDDDLEFDGIIDEVRISDVARSADRILSEFNNQNDNDTFWTRSPVLEDGVDNFLVDDMDDNFVAVQS